MADQVWVEVGEDMGVWVDVAEFDEVDEDTFRREKALIDAEAFDSHYAQQKWEKYQATATAGMDIWDGDEPPF